MSRDEPRALDRYEARYMTETSRTLAHERMPARWQYHATFALVAAIFVAKASTLFIGAVAVGALAVLWLLFAALRVTVTSQHVHVQLGFFGPRIPLECIRSAEAITYDWSRYGGSFIRTKLLRRETLYAMPGNRGRALAIDWTDHRGKSRKTVVACSRPDALAAAIRLEMDKHVALAADAQTAALGAAKEIEP